MLPIVLLVLGEPRLLTLAEALETAKKNQPQMRRAHADAEAADARASQAFAPLLPQLNVNANYQRASANGGFEDQGTSDAIKPSDSFNFINLGVGATQLIWDFGYTWDRMKAAEELAKAGVENEKNTHQQVALDVRTAYFTARANKALVNVAKETLGNQQKHLDQIQAFVEAGTRPEIDLAQARTDIANARVMLINADNGYATAKARLNSAMGLDRVEPYDVADDSMPAVEGEDRDADALLEIAIAARPEIAALGNQVRAQELTLDSISGNYWPRLGVASNFMYAYAEVPFNRFDWNWNASVALTWPFFEGGLTRAQTREASSNVESAKAQLDGLRLSVQVEVEQARLSVLAAKEVVNAAGEASANARERLRLAEGRYETGVGNAIELGDAQLGLTNALAQQVQAEYSLASARATLVKALGSE